MQRADRAQVATVNLHNNLTNAKVVARNRAADPEAVVQQAAIKADEVAAKAAEAGVALKAAVTVLSDERVNPLVHATAWRLPASKRCLMFRQ